MANPYVVPLDATTLISEVAGSSFAFNNKIKAPAVKLLWEKLCDFVAGTLKKQKGVLLPNLGNFRVGPVVGESTKKIRPCFQLLEGRYGGLSQERARYIVGGRAPIVQPSYGQLSVQAGIHRGATQRLVAELLQRLGVHILSGRPVRCEFPGVGVMLTNKAGRFEFVFEPLLSEYFEREHAAVIREMEPGTERDDEEVVKELQALHLGNPPYTISSRPGTAPSVAGVPATPPAHATPVAGSSPQQLTPPAASHHQPFKGELLKLYKLCKQSDRIHSGALPRFQLEEFLHRFARGLLSKVNGATVLDLLSKHGYGYTKKLVLYKPFLQALEALIHAKAASVSPVSDVSPPLDVGGVDHVGRLLDPAPEMKEASFGDMLSPPLQQTPNSDHPSPDQHQHQHYTYQGYPYPAPEDAPWSPRPEASRPSTAPPQRPKHATPPQPEAYLHYAQKQLSPRSRMDYDLFNRMHFDRLQQVRGPAYQRAVTPKVGEEPLNLVEYQAVRQAYPEPQDVRPFLIPNSGTPRPNPAVPPTPGSAPLPAKQNPGGVPGLPPTTSAAPVATPSATSPLPHYLLSPRSAGYRPKSQVFQLLRDPDPLPPSHFPQSSHSSPSKDPQDPTPSPSPRPSPPAPISYYDIQKADPMEKSKLKAELATELQQVWGRQIQERQEFERAVEKAEHQWPFGLTHMPNDKRPMSAISRPLASPRLQRPRS